jgi:ACR3 family arsenite efflux pump ArsB
MYKSLVWKCNIKFDFLYFYRILQLISFQNLDLFKNNCEKRVLDKATLASITTYSIVFLFFAMKGDSILIANSLIIVVALYLFIFNNRYLNYMINDLETR